MKERVRILRGDDWGALLKERLTASPENLEDWMEQHTQILKRDNHSLSGMLRINDYDGFLKLYPHHAPQQKILSALGIGRPLRHFRVAHDLREKGLAVPWPLTCLLVPQGSLLLMEGLSGGGNFTEIWQRGPAPEEACRMMRSAAEALAALHQLQYAHGDCKWGNLYWDGERVYLVDLDNTRKRSGSEQARDLARFVVNAEQLSIGRVNFELFLEVYFKARGVSRYQVVEQMMPFVYQFRAKHVVRYGASGQRLV